MKSMNTLVSENKGFSLVESLVAMAISMIIGGAIVTLLISQTQLTSTQNRNIITQEGLRDALRFMVDEISLTGSGVAEPAITNANTSTFEFIGNLDGEGAWERVTYFLSNGQIQRTLAASIDDGATWTTVGTDVVLDGVTSMTFTYYASGNTVPAGLDDITSVEIQVTTNPNTNTTAITAGKIATQSMVNRATIRNRLL